MNLNITILGYLVCSLFFIGEASATAINFSDSIFNVSDYTAMITESDPGMVSSIKQSSSGNPGTAIDASFSTTNPNFNLIVGLFRSDFSYNPVVDGAVSNISVSLDRTNEVAVNGTNSSAGAYSLRTFIYQAGNYYEAIEIFAGGAFGQWETLSASSLVASDFGRYDFSTGLLNTAINPNFDAAMSFGFGMRSGGPVPGASSISGDLLADNWSITINTVPEPTTIALMALGFTGMAYRRRKTI